MLFVLRSVCELWNDNRGGIVTTELLLVSSVVVTGLLTGLGSFQTSLQNEFEELGNKVQTLVDMPEFASRNMTQVPMIEAEQETQRFTELCLPEDFEFVSED